MSLEVSSRGGFGSFEAGMGDFVSLAMRNRESLSRSKRGVVGGARSQSWSEMKSWPNFVRRAIMQQDMVKC